MSTGNRSVLLVEDDTDIRGALGLLLRDAGYEVIESENGRAALDAIAAKRPDAILLDVMMPEMDGPQFLDALALRAPDVLDRVPIIVLTAARRVAPLPQSVRTVLQKPFEVKKLFATLSEALDPPLH